MQRVGLAVLSQRWHWPLPAHPAGKIVAIEGSLNARVNRVEETSGGKFATDIRADVVDGAEVFQVIIVHGDLNDVFNQHHDFEHGQGIHSEVIKNANIIPFLLEEGARFRLEKTFNDSSDDGRNQAGIFGRAVLDRGVDGLW